MELRDVVEAIERRTAEVVAAVSSLDDDELLAASLLPGWSRLTIACHLRYGAEAFLAMTEATRRGESASYYPAGRSTQRPGTLVPGSGEGPADVVRSLGALSNDLQHAWELVPADDWRLAVVEPDDNPDLGAMRLRDLPIFRLTEVEVHGTDLGLGMGDWSDAFIDTALPIRLERLSRRRPATAAPTDWLFEVDDGPSTLVEALGDRTHVTHTDAAPPNAHIVQLNRRDLVALLLGRAARSDAERVFNLAYPGP